MSFLSRSLTVEDATGDDIALDSGEPVLDLIEPRRVGRREMQSDVRMGEQEQVDLVSLVRCRSKNPTS